MSGDDTALLRLIPHLSTPIWGGHALAREFGRGTDPSASIGESWEIYAGDLVADGPYAGKTLQDVTTLLGEGLLGGAGARHADGHFPLLIKLIDAAQQLSIQVHPDDAQAHEIEHQPFGKTEAWCILRAEPGARLVYGLKHVLSTETLRQHAMNGSIEDDLTYVDVAPGDAVLVPAGTIHAIGSDILLYEVQQTSDTTYRLYDWMRKGPDGKPRELHVEKAAKVARLTPSDTRVVRRTSGVAASTELIRCPYFVLERLDIKEDLERRPAGRSFEALTVIAGAVNVTSPDNAWQPVRLHNGDSVLVPAACPRYCLANDAQGDGSVLVATVPGS
jgi:mannose-6-phosphate isomerase